MRWDRRHMQRPARPVPKCPIGLPNGEDMNTIHYHQMPSVRAGLRRARSWLYAKTHHGYPDTNEITRRRQQWERITGRKLP